ncbi:MAG: EAL domain-containing protein, partial [Solirubrobacteraceae bacterium]
TGYSSLAHLRTLPVGEVKIDRTFVSCMCNEPADAAIVYAVVQLAHKRRAADRPATIESHARGTDSRAQTRPRVGRAA